MKVKNKLLRQLLAFAISVCLILYISLGIILPRILLPIYEKNIYQYLAQPLEFIQNDIDSAVLDEEVAYIYVTSNDEILYSNNMSQIISLSPEQILSYINNDYGKFRYLDKVYYYNTSNSKYGLKIAITNNDYINNIRLDIFSSLFPILFLTILLIALLMVLWSHNLIKKIEYLKVKIDNLGNDDYNDDYAYKTHDEFEILSDAIDNIKKTLKEQEEYKNQMYQSISHDLKTPLTVIKSYLEAIDDGVLNPQEAKCVIKEQVNKLEIKVHSLLYLNKLNYIKDTNSYQNDKVDIKQLLDTLITKFKIQRPDLQFKINVGNNTTFNGTEDMWEAIIDNILNNFMRYAKKRVSITIKNESITFYNDGENIDENILNDIFTPYKKGIKGEFGLGLSIVKKTVSLFGYEISVKNEKKGVTFTIK
ncbi:MAG: HAMP domain-containing sensor histidine kinase [Bacilli bacterium]|nr:HAMP domain-containing sensor histidine kinase [Bacilli bacterium]